MSEAPHRSPAERAALEAGAMARWLSPTSQSRIERIPCDSIDDRAFDPGPADSNAAVALRRSISHRGVVEPLLLRPLDDGRFEVVAGSRRLQAARDVGLATVPAIVRELTDAEATLLAVWAVLPRLDATVLADVADHLVSSGIPAGEIALLLAARGVRAPALGVRTVTLRAAAPLRFAGIETPLQRLLDAMGERRTAALDALAGVNPLSEAS
jgi:ParB-like chromosome segregation protein Spo0J